MMTLSRTDLSCPDGESTYINRYGVRGFHDSGGFFVFGVVDAPADSGVKGFAQTGFREILLCMMFQTVFTSRNFVVFIQPG